MRAWSVLSAPCNVPAEVVDRGLMKERKSETEETKEITFKCRFCEKTKPLGKMRVITRFFPLIVVCSDCENKMR